MKTILVAVDLSPVSAHIIEAAGELAEPLQATIVLLHVVSAVSSCVPIGSSMDVAILPVPPTKEEIKEVKEALETLAASLKARGIVTEIMVKVAFPAEEIQQQATNASLLIVGSHGHGGLYHLFNGSIVTGLLKNATKPILVVPVGGK